MLEEPVLDFLKQSQEWKNYTDISSSLLFKSPPIEEWRSLTSRLQNSGLADSLNIARELFPSSLANWLPEPKTIIGNPMLFDRFADLFPKQISLSDSMNEALRTIEIPGPLRSIQSSVNDLNRKISGMAFRMGDTTWLDTFEQVTVQAKAIVDEAASQTAATKDDLDELRQFVAQSLNSIKEEIHKGAKSPAAIINWVIVIASFLLSLYSAFPDTFKKAGDQSVTKHDIEVVRDAIVTQYHAELDHWAKESEIRVTCAVREKPSIHSLIFQSLKKGRSVRVVNTSHKWANISYLDNDNWPITGWVLKKYLTPPTVQTQTPKTLRLFVAAK